MQKIMEKAIGKKCPVCSSEKVFTNGEAAQCRNCNSFLEIHDLKCIGRPVKYSHRKKAFVCSQCGLLLACTSCQKTMLLNNGEEFVCRTCGKMQSSEKAHEKEYKTQKYIKTFHRIMHSSSIKTHLEKTENGRQILEWIEQIPVKHHWPNPHNASVAAIALAYRDYCRQNPFSAVRQPFL